MIDDFRPPSRSRKPVALHENQNSTESEPFRTPEEVAGEDIPAAVDSSDPLVEEPASSAPDHPEPAQHSSDDHPKWYHLRWPLTKWQWLIIGAVVLLIAGGVTGWRFTHHHKLVAAKPRAVAAKPKPVEPTTVPSNLTGLPVEPEVNNRPVTGIMIENSKDARPQAGLSQAGVVFEAIAEGGITRFLALFQDTKPDNVGPIRSVRPYYLQWALGFDAPVAHVGGSPEALKDIKLWGVKDLDQFRASAYYHRVSNRPAPHNVYTSIDKLNQLEQSRNYTGSTFTSLLRKGNAPAKQPTASKIDLAISSSLYNVHYDYDASSNSYKRSEGGAPHIDANTNTQITPKVVLALVMSYRLAADRHHSDYTTIGTGQLFLFQDGTVTTGQWSKNSGTSQFVFTGPNNLPLNLNAGQTWISVVAAGSKVTYK